MKPLFDVIGTLERANTAYALIGATAMALHGVSRATADIDLLVMNTACLDESTWEGLEALDASIFRGDSDDPLAGVVRLKSDDSFEIDVVVGRPEWQKGVVDRAASLPVGGRDVYVARVSDLILLKLYAGGPQDAWDIHQLLLLDTKDLEAEVSGRLDDLPASSQQLWKQTLAQRAMP